MFREIRKKANEINQKQVKELLKISRRGVLTMNGDDNYPYAIPINYVYDEQENCIYFHGSRSGHKVDAIKGSDKVCFVVYGNETIKEETWAPYMQSVVLFGRCHIIEDQNKKLAKLKQFAMKYYPNEELVNQEINATAKAVQMYEINIEHMRGKEIQEK